MNSLEAIIALVYQHARRFRKICFSESIKHEKVQLLEIILSNQNKTQHRHIIYLLCTLKLYTSPSWRGRNQFTGLGKICLHFPSWSSFLLRKRQNGTRWDKKSMVAHHATQTVWIQQRSLFAFYYIGLLMSPKFYCLGWGPKEALFVTLHFVPPYDEPYDGANRMLRATGVCNKRPPSWAERKVTWQTWSAGLANMARKVICGKS